MPKFPLMESRAVAAPRAVTVPPEDGPSTDETLVLQAWQGLREDVISGALAAGERLRIARLRERYGVGASPIREALSRLVSEGFVVAQERRGFVVAPMSLAEFRDLTDVRKLLEREALRQSIENGRDAWESEVLAAFHRLGKAQERLKTGEANAMHEWEQRNEEFHEALVSACPSLWTLRLRASVYSCMLRYRRVCLSLQAVNRSVHTEHRQLRDAALARDFVLLAQIIDIHLEATFRKVEAAGKLPARHPDV